MKTSAKRTWIIAIFGCTMIVGIGIVVWFLGSSSKELLKTPLFVLGDRSVAENTQLLEPGTLTNKSELAIDYDLQGVCLLNGPASAITLTTENGQAYSVSLATYGKNCAFGEQTARIPIKDFFIDQPLENIRALGFEFWYPTPYALSIKKISVYESATALFNRATGNLLAAVGLSSQNTPLELSRIASGTNPTLGYIGQYWNTSNESSNPKFPISAPRLTRNDSAINFVWGSGSPNFRISPDHFVARWTKIANFDAGTYHFTATADDGVRVFVDNIAIIDQWVDQKATTYTTDLVLAQGMHTVKVEYFEDAGGAVMKFDFQKVAAPSLATSTPGTPPPAPTPTPVSPPTPLPAPTPNPVSPPTPLPLVPAPSATPTVTGTTTAPPTYPTGYTGEYWGTPNESSNPQFPIRAAQLTRNDANINFTWNNGSPDGVISPDHFVARWTKIANFDAGTYHFTATADDGVRVFVDNIAIIDQWVDQKATTYTTDLVLAQGMHTVKVEYFEDAGGAVMKFDFQKVAAPSLATSTPGTPPPAPTPTPVSPPTPLPAPTPNPVSPPTPLPLVPAPSATPTVTGTTTATSWQIRSVSSMKETKDKICNQDNAAFIDSWIGKAQELGANYVAVETPYDNPACGSSVAYTKAWVDAIHARSLNVWHRHSPLAFEGIYNATKDSSKDYLQLISDYIKTNPTFFKEGDIFSPIPEPQNGGISGITYCAQNTCIFANAPAFNKWLRDAITASETAFASIGLGGKIKIGYYGFDGFVAWGDNNPDWHGILEDATVQAMGNITIDHYPELVGDTMQNDLNEIQTRYPNTSIIIGEWGTVTGGDTMSQVQNSMSAALRKNVIGFNYWHMGMGGNEALLNDDFSTKPTFDAVRSFFAR